MPEQSPRLIRVRMTDGFELDPMPENRIVELIRHGIIDRDDLIQRVGSERWRRAIEAGEGLFPAASNIPPALDHAPPALHHAPPALHHAPPPAVTQQQGSPAQESWAGVPAAQALYEKKMKEPEFAEFENSFTTLNKPTLSHIMRPVQVSA